MLFSLKWKSLALQVVDDDYGVDDDFEDAVDRPKSRADTVRLVTASLPYVGRCSLQVGLSNQFASFCCRLCSQVISEDDIVEEHDVQYDVVRDEISDEIVNEVVSEAGSMVEEVPGSDERFGAARPHSRISSVSLIWTCGSCDHAWPIAYTKL